MFSIFQFVFLLYAIIKDAGLVEGTFFEVSHMDFSLVPDGFIVFVEEQKSVLSCGMSCNQDEQCVGFGYSEKDGGKCLAVTQVYTEPKLTVSHTGYTFYRKIRGYLSDCQGYPYSYEGLYIMPGEADTFFIGLCQPRNDGKWLVIQRRFDGSVDFYRNWTEYKAGFGNLTGEFWFGNENLHQLTNHGNYTLRIEMTDQDGIEAAVEYDTFVIGDEASNYTLTVGGYDGSDPPGDSLKNHTGMAFSTYDRDHDVSPRNCAAHFKSAWWYRQCGQSNLNGVYGSNSFFEGVCWETWKGFRYSMVSLKMMVRKK